MKRVAIAVLLGTFFLFGAGSGTAVAQSLLFDYVGFDYEDLDLDPTTFGQVGDGYVGVGEVPGVFAPLVSDQTNFEYTYVFSGLTATARTVIPPFVIVDYTPGTLTLYEDSRSLGTPFDYGINPPNGTVLSTFTDGTAILVGQLTNFRFVYNTLGGSGSYEAVFTPTGGTQIGNLPVNPTGWTFAGATQNALNIPQGYDHQVDGQTFINTPVPTKNATWGQIKGLYR